MNIAMGSLQGPLFANIFMCSIESKLEQANKIPPMYRCFVDDTLVMMPNKEKANEFLHVVNNLLLWKLRATIPFRSLECTSPNLMANLKPKFTENQPIMDYCSIFRVLLITDIKNTLLTQRLCVSFVRIWAPCVTLQRTGTNFVALW